MGHKNNTSLIPQTLFAYAGAIFGYLGASTKYSGNDPMVLLQKLFVEFVCFLVPKQ